MFQENLYLKLGKFGSESQYLFTRRVILSGEIEEKTVKDVTEKLLLLENIEPTKDIVLIIDSYGGDAYDSLYLCDFLSSLKCHIATVTIGKAMSSGFFVAISGTKGKRYITRKATMMNHEISAEAIGKLSEMESEVAECKRLEKVFAELLHEKTACPRRVMKRFSAKEVYFNANECLKYGFVDEIIDKFPLKLYNQSTRII